MQAAVLRPRRRSPRSFTAGCNPGGGNKAPEAPPPPNPASPAATRSSAGARVAGRSTRVRGTWCLRRTGRRTKPRAKRHSPAVRRLKVGTTGRSEATGSHSWALEHPLSPGFAGRHGIPESNVANANFIQTAKQRPGASFVTRPAPAFGENAGGAMEVVVPPDGVVMQSFTMQ